MKLIFLACLILSSSLCFADDCYWKLLSANGSSDSSHFQLNISHIAANENEVMDEQTAINAAQFVAKSVDCHEDLKIGTVDCKKPFKHVPETCLVEPSGLGGYFLVTKDYVDNVNVTFNRWH